MVRPLYIESVLLSPGFIVNLKYTQIVGHFYENYYATDWNSYDQGHYRHNKMKHEQIYPVL
jgi:hypothetical protein